jgi:Big-like domain-containing protein
VTDTGSHTAQDTHNVSVDNDGPPTITLLAPAEGATVSGASVSLTANANDDHGVSKVEWFLDGGASPIATDTDGSNGWSQTWNSTSVGDGSHTITAKATDTTAKTATDGPHTFTVDNVDDAPTVTLAMPAEGAVLKGTVSLSAQANDDHGVTQVEFLLDGTTSLGVDTTPNDGFTGSWDTTTATAGAHTVTARVTDSANQTTDDANGVTVDNGFPNVSITSPATDGTTVSGTVAIAASADDLGGSGVVSVEFFRDNVSLGTDTTSGDGWSFSWNSTTTSNGSHSLTARATDAAGNQTTSGSRLVTVANTLVLDIPVRASADDAEQKANRNVTLNSTDLDMMNDGATTLVAVGMRFTGVNLPTGAQITKAYIQFREDENHAVATTLDVAGEKALTPGAFTTAKSNITNRARTTAHVGWSVPTGWVDAVGTTGLNQRTPELKTVIQEIIGQSGWTSGNAVVLIVTGNPGGELVGTAFDGGATRAPVLHIEYTI